MSYISIVVPVYNVEPYLDRCVNSILEQSFTDYELILVDDGSPDMCGGRCDTYASLDSRIVVIHQLNGGLSAARNSGIDLSFLCSKSEWITFVDSDDWIRNNYLSVLLNGVRKSGLRIGVSAYSEVTDDGNEEENSVPEEMDISPEDFWVQSQGNATVAWGKLYLKVLFDSIRYPVGLLHEDEFTTYKLLFSQERIYVTDKDLYQYYVASNSIMRSQWNSKRVVILNAYADQILYFSRHGFKKAEKESLIRMTYGLLNAKRNLKSFSNRKQLSQMVDSSLASLISRKYDCDLLNSRLLGHAYGLYLEIYLYCSVRFGVLKKTYSETGFTGVLKKLIGAYKNRNI